MRAPGLRPFPAAPAGVHCLDSIEPLVMEPLTQGGPREVVPSQLSWDAADYAADHTLLCDGEGHAWRAYVWRNFDDVHPANVVGGTGVDRVWLAHADAMVTLSYEPTAAPPGSGTYYGVDYEPAGSPSDLAPRHDGRGRSYPYPRRSSVAIVRRMYTPEGFDGGLYPQPFRTVWSP